MAGLLDLERRVAALSTLAQVRDFIASLGAENDIFDYKVQKQDAESTAKLVASFANSRGGLAIFGVNNTGRPVGMAQDRELLVKISRDIRPLSPPIRSENISIIKEFSFSNRRKWIYFLIVRPSLSTDRPHVYKDRVPIRHNGEPQYAKSGKDLRDTFFSHNFNPLHIEQLRSEFQLLKSYKTTQSRLSIFFFRTVKSYVGSLRDERIQQGRPVEIIDTCTASLREIERKIEEIETQPYRVSANTPAPTVFDLERELGTLIDECLRCYEGIVEQ